MPELLLGQLNNLDNLDANGLVLCYVLQIPQTIGLEMKMGIDRGYRHLILLFQSEGVTYNPLGRQGWVLVHNTQPPDVTALLMICAALFPALLL